MTVALTTTKLTEKLASLDALVGNLERDFDAATGDIISGVENAGAKAASIHQHLDRLAVDRQILDRALNRAHQAEADAKAKAEAERRAVHREKARTEAAALIECADRVDGLVDDLVSAVASMQERWRAAHDELRAAGEPSNLTNVGRQSLTPHVIVRLRNIASGAMSYDKTELRCSYWARVGWSDLIGGGSDA